MKTVRKRSEVFDQYTILKNMGKGVGGRLFKARHNATNKVVILKVRRIQILANLEASCDRLQDQFELLKTIPSVNHKHLVRYYDVVCIRYNSYADLCIIMEYIPGPNLYEVMQAMDTQKQGLSVREALLFATGLFNILDELHSRNIVHRDIKPENLMISPSGLILVDFDLMCLDFPTTTHESLPNSLACDFSSYPGTTMYFSPELREASVKRLKNPTHLDPKSIDVWCCGITILDTLTRGTNEKFFAPTLRSTQNKVDGLEVGGRYLMIAKFLRSDRMTKSMKLLRPVLLKILATDPSHRPTASEVLEELEKIQKNNPRVFG
jgi:serine/threonine protein kinase